MKRDRKVSVKNKSHRKSISIRQFSVKKFSLQTLTFSLKKKNTARYFFLSKETIFYKYDKNNKILKTKKILK